MASATARGGSGGALNMVLFYVFLVIFVLASVLPLVWVFKMSIVTKSELYAAPPTTFQHPHHGRIRPDLRRPDVPEGAHKQHDNRLGDHRDPRLWLHNGLRDRQVEVPLQEHGDDADTRDQLLPRGGDHRPALHAVHGGWAHQYLLVGDHNRHGLRPAADDLAPGSILQGATTRPRRRSQGGRGDDDTGLPEGDRAAGGAGVFTTAILTFIYAWNESSPTRSSSTRAPNR